MDGMQPSGDVIKTMGVRFPRRADLLPPRIRHALRNNTYELKEAKAVLKVTQTDDVVMELGGGIGFVSSVVAKRRAVKHIHVFEANADLAGYIRDLHLENGIDNATVHNAILGKRKGTVDFHVRRTLVGSSLSEDAVGGITRTDKVEVMNARSQMRAIKPDVLVCDIEGAEAELIPLLDLSSVRAAVIELHPQWIGPEGVTAVFQAFMAAGLTYYPRLSTQKVVTFRRTWSVK
ncbi:FkbM family methyltransferase [Tateyamaria sp. SN6-1]|uniref:FkbM family methyltransferase n=1 Tax=Tateyamaria sp. SN6-1 TaxID=3092148 RepID=UPI0039F5D279